VTAVPVRSERNWITLGRTVCAVCGISVLLARREEFGENRCRLHRTKGIELKVIEGGMT
jgi:hypothetical protein